MDKQIKRDYLKKIQKRYYDNNRDECILRKTIYYYSKWFSNDYLNNLFKDNDREDALVLIKIEKAKMKLKELENKKIIKPMISSIIKINNQYI
jgi:hypothetical protein